MSEDMAGKIEDPAVVEDEPRAVDTRDGAVLDAIVIRVHHFVVQAEATSAHTDQARSRSHGLWPLSRGCRAPRTARAISGLSRPAMARASSMVFVPKWLAFCPRLSDSVLRPMARMPLNAPLPTAPIPGSAPIDIGSHRDRVAPEVGIELTFGEAVLQRLPHLVVR